MPGCKETPHAGRRGTQARAMAPTHGPYLEFHDAEAHGLLDHVEVVSVFDGVGERQCVVAVREELWVRERPRGRCGWVRERPRGRRVYI